VTAPASPILRWITAGLLLAGAVLALVMPFASAAFLTLMLGSASVVAGISQLLRLSGAADLKAKSFRALSGLLYVAGGLWCLVSPITSTVSLTLFVGAMLAFQGVMELAVAASSPIPARTLVLVDGLITTLLGGLLIAHWPSDSVWALGTLFASGLAISAVNLLTSPSARIASTTDISTAA
jgi:uncharacterized membrane protein HdeD (DUF308 family)